MCHTRANNSNEKKANNVSQFRISQQRTHLTMERTTDRLDVITGAIHDGEYDEQS